MTQRPEVEWFPFAFFPSPAHFLPEPRVLAWCHVTSTETAPTQPLGGEVRSGHSVSLDLMALSTPFPHPTTTVINQLPHSSWWNPNYRGVEVSLNSLAMVWRWVWMAKFPENHFLLRPGLLMREPGPLEHVGTLLQKVNSRHPSSLTWTWQMIKGQKDALFPPPSFH